MKVAMKLIVLLMIGICMLSQNITAVSADDQYCFLLSPPPHTVGGGLVYLKLGYKDYGNHHISLSGTTSEYSHFGTLSNLGLVNGNADMVNGNAEVFLNASEMSSDGTTAGYFIYHLRLDMTTLIGVYTITYPGSAYISGGPASVVSCSDVPF